MKLTPKQQKWCDEYLIDLNATQAAIRAGYSERTAKQQGTENLAKPSLMAVVAKGKRERSERTKINADWVLQRLAMEAEADLADLYNEDGTIKPIHEMPLIWRQGLIAGIDVSQLLNDNEGTITKIKISDRIKRIELIGEHVDVSAFQENMNLTNDLKGASRSDVVDMLKGLLRGE
jgi:phage terminase small subunit